MFFLSPFLRTLSRTGTCCSGVLLTGLFMGELFGFSRPSIGQSNSSLSSLLGSTGHMYVSLFHRGLSTLECFHRLSLLVPLCSVDHLCLSHRPLPHTVLDEWWSRLHAECCPLSGSHPLEQLIPPGKSGQTGDKSHFFQLMTCRKPWSRPGLAENHGFFRLESVTPGAQCVF